MSEINHMPCFLCRFFLFCTYRVLYILYMMSSLGSDKARGPREKALPAATHTSQPQKQIQVSNRHLDMEKKCNESTLWDPSLETRHQCMYSYGNETTLHTLNTLRTFWVSKRSFIQVIMEINFLFNFFLTLRLLLSRSGLPRWSMTRMMLTLRTKLTRWGALTVFSRQCKDPCLGFWAREPVCGHILQRWTHEKLIFDQRCHVLLCTFWSLICHKMCVSRLSKLS